MSVRPGVHVVVYDVAYIPPTLIWSKKLEDRQLDLTIKNNEISLYISNRDVPMIDIDKEGIDDLDKIHKYLKEVLTEEEFLEVQKRLFSYI